MWKMHQMVASCTCPWPWPGLAISDSNLKVKGYASHCRLGPEASVISTLYSLAVLIVKEILENKWTELLTAHSWLSQGRKFMVGITSERVLGKGLTETWVINTSNQSSYKLDFPLSRKMNCFELCVQICIHGLYKDLVPELGRKGKRCSWKCRDDVVGIRQNKENKGCWPKRLKAGVRWCSQWSQRCLSSQWGGAACHLHVRARATNFCVTVTTLYRSATS